MDECSIFLKLGWPRWSLYTPVYWGHACNFKVCGLLCHSDRFIVIGCLMGTDGSQATSSTDWIHGVFSQNGAESKTRNGMLCRVIHNSLFCNLFIYLLTQWSVSGMHMSSEVNNWTINSGNMTSCNYIRHIGKARVLLVLLWDYLSACWIKMPTNLPSWKMPSFEYD